MLRRATNIFLSPSCVFVLFVTSWCAPSFRTLSAAEKAEPIKVAPGDWPWWRGPRGDGVAPAGQKPPLKWSATENVLWKTPVLGRGHASPTVVGKHVYLPTADEKAEIQSVLCYDRATGEVLWKTDVHKGHLDRKGNAKTTQASGSIACDGQRLIFNFLNAGAVYTTALDLAGRVVWQTRVADFATHQGFGSSPLLHGDLVYVTADSRIGGEVVALHRASGEIVWRDSRPKEANYASAVLLKAAGKEQIVVQGCDLVTSFEPLTGKKNWETKGSTVECVTSPVTDGSRVFVSGGYPRNHTQAIEADGSSKTTWQNEFRVYVPSMVVREGFLYAVGDAGVAICWNSATGEEMWKKRIGGTFDASLIIVGDNIWATNEAGQTFIYECRSDKYEPVAENQLGDEVFATPSVCGGRIYHRVAEQKDGVRQETLYCLGTK